MAAAAGTSPSVAGPSYVYAPTVNNEITPERVMDTFHTMGVLYGNAA
jgi:hypothetical protein